MDEERIEAIKYMHNNKEKVHEFDIEWLVEQALKVEAVERILNNITAMPQEKINFIRRVLKN